MKLHLRKDLSFTLGTKLEHNDYTGFEFEPDARLSWNLSSSQTLWAAVSRAVRTPSRIDHDLSEGTPPYLVILKGGSDFASESVIAYEAGLSCAAEFERHHVRLGFLQSIRRCPQHEHHSRAPSCRSSSPTIWKGDTYGMELSGNYQMSEILVAARGLYLAEGAPARQSRAV